MENISKSKQLSFVPDFTGAKSFKEIQERFIASARSIMFSHELRCGEERWRVTALELYLSTDSDVWRDVYTHKNPEQRQSGTWYVHDGGARAPNYSGVDMTCGSAGIPAGLLIRELNMEQRWVLQRIVRGNRPSFTRKGNIWSTEEKAIIDTSIHGTSVESEAGVLRLVEAEEINEPLWGGPRIGLSAKTDGKSLEGYSFRLAVLRIATWPTAKNKSAMNLLDQAIRS